MSAQFKSVEPRLTPPQPRPTHRSGRPRCSPSEEQRHHSVEASVRTSGRQSCVASASKTQICRTARRPRGARAASRARCAGRASDLFFVRPNAPGDDLPSRRRVATRGRRTRSRGAARPPRARAGAGGWASHAARAAIAQPAHPDRARVAHAAPIGCVQVLLARTRPCQTCPPAAARPGTSVGSAARRRRLPASRASAALRVSCTSRGRQVRRQVGALALGLHTLSTTPSLRLQAREVPRDRLQCVLPAQCDRARTAAAAVRKWSVIYSLLCGVATERAGAGRSPFGEDESVSPGEHRLRPCQP